MRTLTPTSNPNPCTSQAPHIDKTDFLNVVVREKKRFENTLDDCVASGLNAGTQVLMNQVCRAHQRNANSSNDDGFPSFSFHTSCTTMTG